VTFGLASGSISTAIELMWQQNNKNISVTITGKISAIIKILCLKFNTAFLSRSYSPSTVVTGSFRQRNYSIYQKVADFANKESLSKSNICSIRISNKCKMKFHFLFNLEMIQYLYWPHVFRLVVTIHHCKTAFVLCGFVSVPYHM